MSSDFVASAADHISPIDVINYFCEIKFDEALARLKAEAEKKKDEGDAKNRNNNTIMMLPKNEGYVYVYIICFELHT